MKFCESDLLLILINIICSDLNDVHKSETDVNTDENVFCLNIEKYVQQGIYKKKICTYIHIIYMTF